jgi:peptidoglycan/LPS O-acetylase OafA/YrhL
MEETMNGYLLVLLVVVIYCSYLSIKVWVDARRAEREAFYRTEAVKKIVELRGEISAPLLEAVRGAIRQHHEPSVWLPYDYNKEREAYYRSETLQRIAATPEGAVALVEYLRVDDKRAARRRGEATKLAGMITMAAGVGMMIFIGLLDNSKPFFMVGLIPALIGMALLVYAFVVVPKAESEGSDNPR